MPDNDRLINERDVELAGYNLTTVLQEAAWAVEPREVPVELTPAFGSGILHLENLSPQEQASFTQILRVTEEALRVAHLMVDRVDADEV
jgi:hypothetical protein